MVDIVMISKSMSVNTVEPGDTIRYPRAGRANAVSDLQIVEFGPVSQNRCPRVVHKRLWGGSVQELYPWAEYIVRFGWLPDGNR